MLCLVTINKLEEARVSSTERELCFIYLIRRYNELEAPLLTDITFGAKVTPEDILAVLSSLLIELQDVWST